jgi:hypothetical protein
MPRLRRHGCRTLRAPLVGTRPVGADIGCYRLPVKSGGWLWFALALGAFPVVAGCGSGGSSSSPALVVNNDGARPVRIVECSEADQTPCVVVKRATLAPVASVTFARTTSAVGSIPDSLVVQSAGEPVRCILVPPIGGPTVLNQPVSSARRGECSIKDLQFAGVPLHSLIRATPLHRRGASGRRHVATMRGSLPISVQTDAQMKAAGNPGPSSSAILRPMSCRSSGSQVTAVGRLAGGFAPQIYPRVGDVVELYVFARPRPGYPAGYQIGLLSRESVGSLGGKRWRVTVPLDRGLGRPARCLVAAQPTHDFQGAPSAY